MNIEIRTRKVTADKSRLMLYYKGIRPRLERLNLLVFNYPQKQNQWRHNEYMRHIAEIIKLKRELRIK